MESQPSSSSTSATRSVKKRDVGEDWKRQLRAQCFDRIRAQRDALRKRVRSGAARSSAREIIADLVADERRRVQMHMVLEEASVSDARSTSVLSVSCSSAPPIVMPTCGSGGAGGGMEIERGEGVGGRRRRGDTQRFAQGVARAAQDDGLMSLSSDEYVDLMTCLEEALMLESLEGLGPVATHAAPPLTDEDALEQHAAMEALEMAALCDAISAWEGLAESPVASSGGGGGGGGGRRGKRL